MSAEIFGAMAGIMGNAAASQMSAQMNERMQLHQLKWEREKLANEQAYATQMSNTAHQREMEDLKKSGINPILTATGGQGASTPTPQGGSIGIVPDQTGATLGAAINTAVSALAQKRENDIKKQTADASANLMEKQGAEATAAAIKHLSESGALDAKAKESAANALLYEQKVDNLRKEGQILQNQIDNKEYYKAQLIYEIKNLREQIKNSRENRIKQRKEEDLIDAEKKLTETKQDLYKLGHIAGVIGAAATGIGGITGAIANTGKILNMIKSVKTIGFLAK